MSFDSRALDLLRYAGWHEGRSIDVTAIKQGLQERGYEMFPVVEEFLREFVGLTLSFAFDSKRGIFIDLWIDPLSAAKSLPSSGKMAQIYRQCIGSPICVIGYRDHDVLMMDQNGKVYSCSDEYLDLIGEGGREAIANMLRGKDMSFKRLLQPDTPDYDVV